MSQEKNVTRRDFVKTAVGAGVALGVVSAVRPAHARVAGANDRVNLGFLGCGGRSRDLLTEFSAIGAQDNNVHIAAVCDVYEKRKKAAAEKSPGIAA